MKRYTAGLKSHNINDPYEHTPSGLRLIMVTNIQSMVVLHCLQQLKYNISFCESIASKVRFDVVTTDDLASESWHMEPPPAPPQPPSPGLPAIQQQHKSDLSLDVRLSLYMHKVYKR